MFYRGYPNEHRGSLIYCLIVGAFDFEYLQKRLRLVNC